MSKHTPAPWSVHSYSHDEHIIPEVWYRNDDGEFSDHIQSISDARLIATAPKMLKALQRLTHPMADDDDLAYALEVIREATNE